jgi:hypothetical protein
MVDFLIELLITIKGMFKIKKVTIEEEEVYICPQA